MQDSHHLRFLDADVLAHYIRERAGHAHCGPVDGCALAESLGIPVRYSCPPWIVGEAELERVGNGFGIILQTGLSTASASFAACHELAHVEIRRRHIVLSHVDEEAFADRVAAATVMPISRYMQDVILMAPHFPLLASKYQTTQAATALRYGEVTSRPVAVVGNASVRLSGDYYPWPGAPELRKIAAHGSRHFTTVQLTDQGRVAVLAA